MEFRTQMLVENGRRARFIPALLAIVGSAALAAGLFVAVITMTRTPANHRGINMPFGGGVYVGGDTCFTCHQDEDPDWSLTLDLQPAAPMANPHIVEADMSTRAVMPHLDFADSSVLPEDGKDRQQYIIETEDDQAILPRRMSAAAVLKPLQAARLRRQSSATTTM